MIFGDNPGRDGQHGRGEDLSGGGAGGGRRVSLASDINKEFSTTDKQLGNWSGMATTRRRCSCTTTWPSCPSGSQRSDPCWHPDTGGGGGGGVMRQAMYFGLSFGRVGVEAVFSANIEKQRQAVWAQCVQLWKMFTFLVFRWLFHKLSFSRILSYNFLIISFLTKLFEEVEIM